MTFASMIENNNNTENTANNAESNANNAVIEFLQLKVSYGNEIRRTSIGAASSFEALCELVAKLFNVEQASVLLKYQDEENDKITMSSDVELQCAVKSVKENQLLRLFVEVKAPLPTPPASDPNEKPSIVLALGRFPHLNRAGCGPRVGHGPHTVQGPLALHGPHAHRHHGSHAHYPRGPHEIHAHHHHAHPHHAHGPHAVYAHPHPHPHPHHAHGPHENHAHHRHGHHGPHHRHGPREAHAHHHHAHPHHGPHRGGFYGSHGSFEINAADPSQVEINPAHLSSSSHQEGEVHFSTPRMFAHGTFSPASEQQQQEPHPTLLHPLFLRCDMKREDRRSMREKIKLMKANALTDEDKQAINDARQQMIAEFRARWMERRSGVMDKREKRCRHNNNNNNEREERLKAEVVADVTIPDHSEISADTPACKTWRLRNAGSAAWPEDAQLISSRRFGYQLNGPERIEVGRKVEPQEEIEISVNFISPLESGDYVAFYRLADGTGNKFGQRMKVSFTIPAATESIIDATTKLSL